MRAVKNIRWRPANHPLNEERPFLPRRMEPAEAALTTMLLGPALLLPPRLVPWLLFLLLLMLNALAWSALPGRNRFSSRSGTRSILAMLVLVPLESQLMIWLVSQTGLDPAFNLAELGLLLVAHLSVLLFLQGRARLEERDRRRWSVQAIFWLPAASLLPFTATLGEHGMIRLFTQLELTAAAELASSGLPRLVLSALTLGILQLKTRRRLQRAELEEGK
jgi:hypothetical protein